MRTLIKLLVGVVCLGLAELVPPSEGQITVVVGQPLSAPPAATYLVEENFTTTGTPAGWSVIAGTPDFDVTGLASPNGGEAVRMDGTAATVSADHTALADRGEAWGYFQLYVTTMPATGSKELIRFQLNGGQSSSSELRLTSTGGLLIAVGTTVSTETVSKLSTGTWYHVFWYHGKGTGADGRGWVAFSTDGTIGTGGALSDRVNMNGTVDFDIARLSSQFSTDGGNVVFDRFLIDDVAIAANP